LYFRLTKDKKSKKFNCLLDLFKLQTVHYSLDLDLYIYHFY
jgi:hypothetical protein